jgi:hypothetical protein
MNEFFPFGFIIAIVTGLLGSTFFMLIEVQKRISEGSLTDARDMWTSWMILLRCIVGIGAASILYFFFKTGLLDGTLWPKLDQQGFLKLASVKEPPTYYVPNGDFALLIVWSFLAGYSQTLVPNLLLNTESRQGAIP